MYFVTSDNVIYLTRGDTLSLTVGLYEGDVPYEPQSGDVIRFALKNNKFNYQGTEYTDQEPLIEKVIPNDTLKLTILPSETASLGFGDYVYDIQLTKNDGSVDTFIPPTAFKIMPEVD